MEIRTGIDSTEIKRIARSIGREGFLPRVYTQEECLQLEAKKRSPQTAAGYFAAKEAFGKAMGVGIMTHFRLNEVGVVYETNGAPELLLTGKAAELAAGWCFSLSITHTRETATAIVIAYRD